MVGYDNVYAFYVTDLTPHVEQCTRTAESMDETGGCISLLCWQNQLIAFAGHTARCCLDRCCHSRKPTAQDHCNPMKKYRKYRIEKTAKNSFFSKNVVYFIYIRVKNFQKECISPC